MGENDLSIKSKVWMIYRQIQLRLAVVDLDADLTLYYFLTIASVHQVAY